MLFLILLLKGTLVSCQHFSPISAKGGDAPSSHLSQTGSSAEKKRKIVLILGPGLAKSYAHLGVLQELEKEKIPVQAFVGLGWGAIMAAFHLQGVSQGMFWAEWQMRKLQIKQQWGSKYFSAKRIHPQPLKKVQKFIEQNLSLPSKVHQVNQVAPVVQAPQAVQAVQAPQAVQAVQAVQAPQAVQRASCASLQASETVQASETALAPQATSQTTQTIQSQSSQTMETFNGMMGFACPYISLMTEELYWQESITSSGLLPCLATPYFFLPHSGKYIPALFELSKVVEWVRSRYGEEAYLVFINPLSSMTARARRRLLKDMGGEGLLFRQQLYRQLLQHRSQWDHYFELAGGEDLSWSDFSKKRKNIVLGRQLGKTLSRYLHEKYEF